MCLIGIALGASEKYPFILAANRDEVHSRPTLAAHWWPEDPNILAGRDLEAGGTWLGVTRTGRLAAVTNIHNPRHLRGVMSRGRLVADFLGTTFPAGDYSNRVLEQRGEYSPFNLILSEGANVLYVNHTGASGALDRGIHALSNAPIGDDWPKTERMRDGMREALEQDEPREALLALLGEELAGGARNDYRATLFIRGAEFGTRSSSVVMISAERVLDFTEWQFDPSGNRQNEARFLVPLAG